MIPLGNGRVTSPVDSFCSVAKK